MPVEQIILMIWRGLSASASLTECEIVNVAEGRVCGAAEINTGRG